MAAKTQHDGHSRTTALPSGVVRSTPAGAEAATRLSVLTHELANLLDGSMRCLQNVRRALPRSPERGGGKEGGADHADLSRRLETIYTAMEQMASLVRGAVRNGSGMPGSARPRSPESAARFAGCATLTDAVRHAAEVMRPVAESAGVVLVASVDDELGNVPSGPVYPVITAAIRNAVEAISGGRPGRALVGGRAGAWGGGGSIRVTARRAGEGRHAGGSPSDILITVTDDGPGLADLPGVDAERVFELGFSTKPGGTGIGLTMARSLIAELGGSVELLVSEPGAPTGRRGAVLRVRYPAPDGVYEDPTSLAPATPTAAPAPTADTDPYLF